MTERLVIENFGPIKKADVDLRELTVFVGPQATGKSLAAQSVYFLRRYETLLLSLSDTPHKATISALEKWFGQDLSIYVNSKTKLYWNPSEPDEKSAKI
ncbi:MAG TPA: AAA family ATPase [Chloroflexi bacterium]|nr:AAA family ATPase [Chloroflexota bacterium]